MKILSTIVAILAVVVAALTIVCVRLTAEIGELKNSDITSDCGRLEKRIDLVQEDLIEYWGSSESPKNAEGAAIGQLYPEEVYEWVRESWPFRLDDKSIFRFHPANRPKSIHDPTSN